MVMKTETSFIAVIKEGHEKEDMCLQLNTIISHNDDDA